MQKIREKILNFIFLVNFKFLVFILKILPRELSFKIGEKLGLILYYLWNRRRHIALNSIKETLSRIILKTDLEPQRISKKVFSNLGRSFVEILRLYSGDRKILSTVSFKGLENFYEAKRAGKGIIFLTGHCGNWELMAIAFGARVEPLGVVARPLNNKGLNYIVEKIRTRYGNTVIYKKGAIRHILRYLRENRPIGILMDQSVLKEEGLLIDFLGRPAWTSKMPALIAKKSGARVLPAFIKHTSAGHIVEIGNPIELTGDIREDTKRLSSPIERFIIENPTEWLWIHRRWKQRT